MDVTRRDFVAGGVTLAVVACCGLPDAAAADPASRSAGPIDAGDPTKLAEGINDSLAKSQKLLLVRTGKKVYASTSICTHKRCALKVAGKESLCPCHGSKFDLEGKPTKGPASEPLRRYAVSLVGGRLMVDTATVIDPDKWADDGAFVTLP